MKDKTIALLLSIFCGGLGIDRFYLGYTGMGILKLLTGGCVGVLWIIDIINIATGKLMPADGTDYVGGNVTSDTSAKASNPFEDIRKLADLHEQGVLSDEEFYKMKTDIIARM